MTIIEAHRQLLMQLYEMYDEREAANINDLVMEKITGFRKTDRLVHKNDSLDERQLAELTRCSDELLKHKPVQYVLGEAWFAGMRFIVDEHVLIPRPETEELADWIITSCRTRGGRFHILDIGSGSGCIAITLKKKLPQCDVHALDVSEAAIGIARQNATLLQTEIQFHTADILDETTWNKLPAFDIIVSNPPYITRNEAQGMHPNVLFYEPHIALFVPDSDPLIFYRYIARFSQQHLNADGMLFLEINESLGNDTQQLLRDYGFTDTEIKKDLQGKDRMLKAAVTRTV